jgi:gliding motility-associated-like protein
MVAMVDLLTRFPPGLSNFFYFRKYTKTLSLFVRIVKVAFGFIFFLSITGPVFSQGCFPIFKKIYGGDGNDEALDIFYTADKGSIVAGRTTSTTGTGNYDGLIMKLDEQGNVQWCRRIGGNGYDELVKIKQTIDGGYVSIGLTKSFGNVSGEIWVTKFDPTGNLTWARHYGKPGIYIKSKEIIQLNDGGYAFVANENDSNPQGHGIACKLDPSGNLLWTRIFDHGDDDGLNDILEHGDTLYVSGYATIDYRDGILMCLNKSTGNVISAKKYVRLPGQYDEILNLENTQDGIAFGVSSAAVSPTGSFYSYSLTLFKQRNDGTVYYQRRADISGTKIEYTTLRATHDSGFIYLYNDTISNGHPIFVEVSPTGRAEWGRNTYGAEPVNKMRGLDRTGSDGYLLAGYQNSFQTSFKNKIYVFKTDIVGRVGACAFGIPGNYIDSTIYTISNFNWNTVLSINLPISDAINPNVTNLAFSVNMICQQSVCNFGPPMSDSCSSSFLIKYKGEQYLKAVDVAGTNDGGFVMVGHYGMFNNTEPCILKLKPNGDIQWAKTLNNYIHTALFKKILPTSDGNIIILGVDNYTINHGSSDSSILIKINSNTGQVLWSRYCIGDGYDIAATNDGGFVICLNEDYGYPPIYNYVFRMDVNGNIVWQKKLKVSGGGIPIYRSILFDGTNIYVASDNYLTQPTVVQVDKLDGSSGNRIWAKRFMNNGQTLYMESVIKIADTIFTVLNMPDNNYHYNLGILKLNLNGDQIGGFKLSPPNYSGMSLSFDATYNEHRPNHFIKTDDNNFIVADQTVDNSDTSLTVTKFNPIGEILWSRKFSNMKKQFVSAIKDHFGSLLIAGRKFNGIVENNLDFDAFLMKTNADGQVSANATGDCYNSLIGPIVSNLVLDTIYPVGDSMINTSAISFSSYLPYHRPINVWAEPSCSVVSACTSIIISGNQNICNLSDTIFYSIQRNPGCSSPVSWIVDPLHAVVVSSTDTTANIHFINSGTTYVIARLNAGCTLLSDTIWVTIIRSANSLNLGADTMICAGNNLQLNAGSGFVNYLWQDNSTDSTFNVTSPGIFYIHVTDACGGSASDTITVTPHPPIPINIGPDRIKCNTDTIHLNAPPGFLNYTWSPAYNINSTVGQNVIVNPFADTSYMLKAEQTPGCFAYDTVHIVVYVSPPINLGADTSFCSGQGIQLNAGAGFTQYTWSTGATSQQITVNSAGSFSVAALTNNGCKSYDTLIVLNIYPLPLVSLNDDSTICEGEVRQLDAGTGFNSYLWNNGSTSRTIVVTGTGIFSVIVTDMNGCRSGDTTLITSLLASPKLFLPPDTAICSYGTLQLKSQQIFNQYLWKDGSIVSAITINQPGLYWLQVRDNNNCVGRDTIIVNPKDCLKGLYVPSAFTPNKDGKNDIFKPLLFGKVRQFHFTIYNRWGQIVFETSQLDKGWDGKLSGIDQDSNAFVWICQFQFEGEEPQVQKGTFVLIR